MREANNDDIDALLDATIAKASGRPRVRYRPGRAVDDLKRLLADKGVNTVCQNAHCPNVGECFADGTATFLILGNTCTRHCRFCAIASDRRPVAPDPLEPHRILDAARALDLRYAVITSVTRDDLPLGGAEYFAVAIGLLREAIGGMKVEVLTPDFGGNHDALDLVLAARPDVFNHNMETVRDLYPQVRPEASYDRSLDVLGRAASRSPRIVTKSGIMVGLGETPAQVSALLRDLRHVGCAILTIGQYLAPSPKHHPVVEYVAPEQFERYREEALRLGFRQVASAPLVRSSYHAGNLLDELKDTVFWS